MKSQSRGYRVLIIDDEQSWARSIGQWLKKSFTDLEVVLAHNGRQGIEDAEKFHPDLLLVDILLPDLNGLQITRMLRSMPDFANTPIVLMTILQSDERLLQESLEAGADLYLQKPFDPTELQEIVGLCLQIVDAHRNLSNKQEEVNRLRWSLHAMSKGSASRGRNSQHNAQRAMRAMQLFENAPDAIIITLPDGVILEVNNMVCEYSGYSRYELIGNNVSTLFSESELSRQPFEKARVLAGEIVEKERKLLRKSGLEMPVWMKSMLMPDGTVVSFLRDISQIRQTEEELRRQKAFSQSITDKIPNIIYLHDLRQRRNVYYNRSVAALLGYPPEVLTDDDDDFFEKVVHPDDLRMFDEFYATSDLSNPELIFHFEYRIKNYAGQWRWFRGYEKVWEQQNGQITMLIGSVLDVTSEKEKEEALRQSEKKYRELMELFRRVSDNMPDMLWAKDVNKRFIFVNKSICQNLLHAANTEEPIGKTDLFFAERIRAEKPDDRSYHTFGEICQDSDEVILQTRRPGQFEEFGNVKGKFLFLDVIKAPIFDEHGELIAIVGAGRDITERNRQEKYLSIQHAVADALATTDNLRSLIETIEQELSKVIDTSNFYVALINEATGLLYTPFFKDEKDDIEEWEMEGSATGLVITTGKPHHLKRPEFEEMFRTGKIKSIGTTAASWLGVPLFSNNGVVGAMVVQNYEDEDAFKDYDIELLEFLANQLGVYIQRMKALEQTRMLGLAIEQSPAGVMMTNHLGKLVYTNKRFVEISGYDMSINVMTPEVVYQMFESDEVTQEIYQCIFTQSEYKKELRLTRPDKSKIWISLSLSPLLDTEGKVVNWLVTIEDHTEKRRMLDDLIHARDKAEESDRLKSAFLMNISHEIRTPLNSIMGFADLLAERQNQSMEEVRKQGALIYKNGQRLLTLINNILKISKIDAREESVNTVEFSPATLIDEVVSSFAPQAARQGLTMIASYDAAHLNTMIASDRLKIHQIIDNLVNNALKFTQQGQIEVGFEMHDKTIQFYVSDTGRGIPETELERIFERFYQADNSLNRGYEGVGLGLALCDSMVKLMNGHIWAESESGKGSVFRFEIPLVKVSRVAESEDKNEDIPIPLAQTHASGSILVVDDDEPSLVMMKAMLASTGYKLMFASDGLEALQVLAEHPEISLIMLDIKMPQLDGLEAIRRIREMGIKSVVIATTAYAMPGDESRILKAGFDGYLAKPVSRRQIMHLIEKYMR